MSIGMSLFLFAVAIFVVRLFVWARRWWRNLASPLWVKGIEIKDMEPVKQRTAPPVRLRWWHEPAVWSLGFALLCIGNAMIIAASMIWPPPPDPRLVAHGLAHLDPGSPFGSDGVWMLVFLAFLAISFVLDARTERYTINDDGILRKRWFRGEYLIPWEDVQSVGINDYWPVNLLINFKKPNGREGHLHLVNGFYTRKAFEPVVYRLLGRRTVLEEEAPQSERVEKRPEAPVPPSV